MDRGGRVAVSVRDVAREAGVSVGTVSNVLNRPDMVSPATVERVSSVIDRLGFVRNDAARQLRAGRSRSFGLVTLDARNPFFMDVSQGAQLRALDNGHTVLTGTSSQNAQTEQKLLDLFEEQRVAGVMITPLSSNLNSLQRLRQVGTPVVLVDRVSADGAFSSVSVDDYRGGQIAAEHLISIGRHRITFVGGPTDLEQVRQRLEGARSIVAATADCTLHHVPTTELSVREGRMVGERITAQQPHERPDAIFAANDLLALGVLQAFALNGDVRVPEDIALIGYDDIDYAESAVVPLSTIQQPALEIGRTAVDLLLREASAKESTGHEQVVFTPKLVVRSSTFAHEPHAD